MLNSSEKAVVAKTHPLKSLAKILLCSIFGPYGQNDEYGSRELKPMELYHSQVTRTQGPFSLRMFHQSWGLMMIQANIEAPCILLDFPTLTRFIQELRDHQYDIVGISSIIPNILKVTKMCELIRQYQPKATIVVGGHIANMPRLNEKIGVDFVVQGDGIRWFRQFLGENESKPLRHPMIISGLGTRTCGVSLKERPVDVAATVISSVGCPLGCNFCSTSAMFGGKGKCVHFYNTGDELFHIMLQFEVNMKVRSFFMMDENFLLHRKRALRLLELMEKYNKAWSLYVFTSANILRSYTMDQLIRLGISWVWMGIEGSNSQYKKLLNVDSFSLVQELQSNGIRVLGSTIIGLENHSNDNIDKVIEDAVLHNTDFHQFMLYIPLPGTPLHKELSDKGMIKDEKEFNIADIHGQSILNYRHPSLSDEQATKFLLRAFNHDFWVNGPSVMRIVRTTLDGWLQHKSHPDLRVRNRFIWETRELATNFSALVGAVKLYYRDTPIDTPIMDNKISVLLNKLHTEFGWKSRLFSFVGGYWMLRKIHKEEKRLAFGFKYEPPTFYEGNEAMIKYRPEVPLRRFATPLLS